MPGSLFPRISPQTIVAQAFREPLVGLIVGDDALRLYLGYRKGDVLLGQITQARQLHNQLGSECIIELATGERMVRILAKGSAPGRFNLRAGDPALQEIQDAKVRWAARVQLILRPPR